jgi:intein/homing endonuclease
MNFDINQLKKSNDLALFLGMFAGDGSITIKHNGKGYRIYPIRFFNTNKLLVNLFSNLFYDLFGIRGVVRGRARLNKQVLWEFEKYSVQIYNIIVDDFEIPCGKKASKVRVPSFIRCGNKELKKHFFFGLLITDGGLRNRGDIIFHSASKSLSYDLQKLIKDTWRFDRKVREYLQNGKYKSYQLTLKKGETSKVLEDMPQSHNLVVRQLSFCLEDKRKP